LNNNYVELNGHLQHTTFARRTSNHGRLLFRAVTNLFHCTVTQYVANLATLKAKMIVMWYVT